MEFVIVSGEIMPIHGVASGKGEDKRCPLGTLRQYFMHFLKRGLDLSDYFTGTLNQGISHFSYEIKTPQFFFKDKTWSDYIPPKNFYLFDASLHYQHQSYKGLVYLPDPETKKDHMQKSNILELIFPKIEGLEYGARVDIELKNDQLEIIKNKTDQS